MIELVDDIELSLISGFLDGIKPDPIMTVSEWADTKRILPPSAPEPGPYNTSRTPYAKEIMDRLSVHDPATKIIVKKGSQIGMTEVGNNWVGYVVDVAPANMLYLMPTDALMKKTSKERIETMLAATPSIAEKMPKKRAKDSHNTLLHKEFPGMFLNMVGANSPVGLSSASVRFVYGDEIDRMPKNVGNEGSPVDLADTRTSFYGNRRKMFLTSTPTIKGDSIIDTEFEKTGQRYYHLPCPHCNYYQPLVFEQLKYEVGKYDNVQYECVNCKQLIPEHRKTWMLANGQWVPKFPDKEDGFTFGYHLSAMYAPYGTYSWRKMAQDYENSRGDIPKKIVFVNTKLGECYEEEQGDKPDWESLYDRAESYEPNQPFASVAFITAGVDVQADRIEVEVVGWMKGKISQSIDYRVLVGDTSQNEVWRELDKVVNESWVRQGDGAELPLRYMAIDTGYATDKVYEFTKKHSISKVIPIKGRDKLNMFFASPQKVEVIKAGKKLGKVQVWGVGVSLIKSEIYGFLKLRINSDTGEIPQGYCHFPNNREPNYFRGLTAEEVVQVVNKRNFEEFVWVKKYKRNEPLDCFDEKTEVLTKDGFIRFSQLSYSNELATVNLETDRIVYQRPSHIIARHHSGDMIELKGVRIDILVTPNHRMVTYKKENRTVNGVRKWVFDVPPKITLAKDLTVHHRIKMSASWQGEKAEYISVDASYKEDSNAEIEPRRLVNAIDFATFLGWYISEGCRAKNFSKTQKGYKYRVEITQIKSEGIAILKELLAKLPWGFRYDSSTKKFVCSSKQLYEALAVCGDKVYYKQVPQYIKEASPEVINAFLNAAIAGDGWVQKQKQHHKEHRRYCTVSKKLADDMQELFLKIGRATNMKVVPGKPYKIRGRSGDNVVEQYHVSELTTLHAHLDGGGNGKRGYIGKTIQYSGMVYCATVPNGTLICRRNGKVFIAGNCRVYARAAAAIAGMDRWTDERWDRELMSAEVPTPKKQATNPVKKKQRSSFW